MALENPFHDPLRFKPRVPECAMVIFGATGDLTKRKLMPALYRLAHDRRLPAGFSIVGVARTERTDEQFRESMRKAVDEFSEDTKVDPEVWKAFAEGIFYVAGDIAELPVFRELAKKLDEIERTRHTSGNVLFYLATQPSQYEAAVHGIGEAGMGKGNGWRRLIVEKPFGHDLESARKLSDELHKVFPESEVYRIDHYLGKETVQNILALRFGNGIFEPLWNRQYVDHIQITAAESIGIEGRGKYYEEVGASGDMIQNHLLQMMATVAMEPPAGFQAETVRDERAKLLRSIHRMKPEEIRRDSVPGQYGAARIGNDGVMAYREEKDVQPDSQTETYAAIAFFVENWRWAGVPFYLRTGKRLPKRVTEIAIRFHPAPLSIFEDQDSVKGMPNLLILRIQPEEGISLKFLSKLPGEGMTLRPVSMDFNYGSSFGERSPSAYETLLIDAFIGDPTLYTRQDMVEASWEVVEPIQKQWRSTKRDFPNYAAGTWGPIEANEMIARRGHQWRKP